MTAYSYATIEDYELRTGIDVPVDQEDTVTVRLDDASSLIALYLGGCEPDVAAAFPEVLTALVCSMVFRYNTVPAGVRSKSIGATSVTYTDEAASQQMLAAEQHLLDDLMARACPDNGGSDLVPGLGVVGANWGGPANYAAHWARYVDLWVL
jgi:hypothetical protein